MDLTKRTADRFSVFSTQMRFVGFPPVNKYQYIDNWTKLELKKFHTDDLKRLYAELTSIIFSGMYDKKITDLAKKVRTRIIDLNVEKTINKQKGVAS